MCLPAEVLCCSSDSVLALPGSSEQLKDMHNAAHMLHVSKQNATSVASSRLVHGKQLLSIWRTHAHDGVRSQVHLLCSRG